MGAAGQVVPAPHEARPVHVNERDRDAQVLAGDVVEEVFVGEAVAALVEVVDVRVSGEPAEVAGVEEAVELQGQLGVVAGGDLNGVVDGAVLEPLAHLNHHGTGGHLHLEVAGCAEVVCLGRSEDAVEPVPGSVATAVRAVNRDAGGGGAAGLVHHGRPQAPDGVQVRAVANVQRLPGTPRAPETAITCSSVGPFSFETKAMRSPSGLTRGVNSWLVPPVSRRGLPPPAPSSTRSFEPASSDTYTRALPSGSQSGRAR